MLTRVGWGVLFAGLMTAPILVFAVGNESRGDDALAPLLLRDLAGSAEAAGQVDLIELPVAGRTHRPAKSQCGVVVDADMSRRTVHFRNCC
jgi:hypothetical protein